MDLASKFLIKMHARKEPLAINRAPLAIGLLLRHCSQSIVQYRWRHQPPEREVSKEERGGAPEGFRETPFLRMEEEGGAL